MAKLFKNKYRIDSCRLKGWDYSWPGYYFVTICVKNRICHFGEVVDCKMVLNRFGYIAKNYYREIPKHFPHVKLDSFIVMPNHIHGIIVINKNKIINDEMPFIDFENNKPGRNEAMPRLYYDNGDNGKNISPKSGSLPVIVGSFKSIVAKSIKKINIEFAWQARFYDHIIRNEKSLNNIRQYITDNPQNWWCDRNNQERLYLSLIHI